MKSKYIIVPMLLSVLTFGGTSTALAQAVTAPGYESTFEKLKEVLLSIQHFFDNTLATVTGSYDVVGAVTVSTPVTADFGLVEYYPNLKTKIGFAQNFKEVLADPATLTAKLDALDAIGPGLVCSNNEFDMWYRYPDPAENNPALVVTAANSVTERPTAISANPSLILTQYQTQLGDKNISQLVQLTGAPAQYQLPDGARIDTGDNNNVHPAPTDVTATADFMGKWAAGANHPYPILWSFWNEPIHTFATVNRTLDTFGNVILPNETKHEFDIRERAQLGTSSLDFAKLYAVHERQIRPNMNRYSQLGLASFLAADFNPYHVTPQSKVYFEAVESALRSKYPNVTQDFISFNNFNGGWPVSISGARTVLGTLGITNTPLVITQYSPGSLKVSEGGDLIGSSVSPMKVSTDMLTDLAQLERATDFRSICMSYWVGGNYGFLTQNTPTNLIKNERYEVIKLFAELPTVRAKIDMGAATSNGVHALAGVNQAKVGVLLWNTGSNTVSLPVTLNRVPRAYANVVPSLKIISEENASLTTHTLVMSASGTVTVSLPPRSVALVEMKSTNISDPLLRRNAIMSDNGSVKTRFLQTKVMTDRMPFDCTAVTKLPNIATSSCYRNTGTYGFFDSVRSIAYLGRGEGSTPAKVTATYESLPSKLYIQSSAYAYSGAGLTASSSPVRVSAYFPACDKTVATSVDLHGYLSLDMNSLIINPPCRNAKAAILTFEMAGSVQSGTQAEIYVTSDIVAATELKVNNRPLTLRNIRIDTAEKLVVKPFFQAMTGEKRVVLESMRVIAIQACSTHDISCPRYTNMLALRAKDGAILTTFTVPERKVDGVVVQAVRGNYTIVTASSANTANPIECRAISGAVETSKGIMNNVTVECPVQ